MVGPLCGRRLVEDGLSAASTSHGSIFPHRIDAANLIPLQAIQAKSDFQGPLCDGGTSTGSMKIGWYACRDDSFRTPAIEVMFVELFHVARGSVGANSIKSRTGESREARCVIYPTLIGMEIYQSSSSSSSSFLRGRQERFRLATHHPSPSITRLLLLTATYA